MTDVLCPVCGKPNPEELDECQFCGARIKPTGAFTPDDSQSIRPGQEPVRKNTSELGKVSLPGEKTIHPGEVPTKKNTAELERALPSWLRSLRDGKRPAAGEALAEPSMDENLPAAAEAAPTPESSGEPTDWLAGLGEAASEDEAVPDWLAGLRSENTIESTPFAASEEQQAPESDNSDWMARLDSQPQDGLPETPVGENALAPDQPAFETSSEPVSREDTPDWLQSMQSGLTEAQQSPQPDVQENPSAAQSGENLPEWLSGLPGISAESSSALSGTGQPAPLESTPDWLGQLKQKSVTPDSGIPAGRDESVPDWLSSFGSEPGTPASALGENVPEWLSNLEEKSGPASGTSSALFGSEPEPSSPPSKKVSDWLSRLQEDVNTAQDVQTHKDDFEVVSKPSAPKKGTEPLPDWLSGIQPTGPTSSGTPALIADNKDNPPAEQSETAFAMETPDWLSKLNPEQAAEKTVENNEAQADSENLEVAELPSWVQAMRPVESVVETKTALLDENQVTEHSGPLAGLRGVLPTAPGLGPLRKPPAYSAKLHVSDGQRRYASYLERLVTSEANPRAARTTRLTSNQLWRWLITALLFMAVGIPIASGAQVAYPTLLKSSDNGASSIIIDGLAGSQPVLVAFDYDPALSGELEAVAAPILDRLLSKGIPLVLVSTSPTGPALAEHFLQNVPTRKMYPYTGGEQYLNLGYLAGGPAGISYFADAPANAMPFSVDDKPAWETGPLQGIQYISDFAAVIILTDNADTGRNWIEQAGRRLGNTPMVMMISAQAEPMIRPYFDSGQLKGLVSGLLDAKIYEQKYGPFGLANKYWDSFRIGMLVAELLIIAGAVFGVVTDWRARRKKSGEGA